MQNILVVEDDPDLNQAIGYALQKAGYGVYSTATIKGGEKLFRGNPYSRYYWCRGFWECWY